MKPLKWKQGLKQCFDLPHRINMFVQSHVLKLLPYTYMIYAYTSQSYEILHPAVVGNLILLGQLLQAVVKGIVEHMHKIN